MPELSPRDRMQPFLLERLTDDEPEARLESRDKRVFSPRQVQASILRDLAWLLNSKAHPEADGLTEFSEVAKSVLNYGLPDLTGQTVATINRGQLERMVHQTLLAFEPRIRPQTLSVHIIEDEDEMDSPKVVAFEIRGEIRASQASEALYLKTELDLETGAITLKDRGNG